MGTDALGIGVLVAIVFVLLPLGTTWVTLRIAKFLGVSESSLKSMPGKVFALALLIWLYLIILNPGSFVSKILTL